MAYKSAIKRIALEYKSIEEEQTECYSITPDDKNIFKCPGMFYGAVHTPFEGGTWSFEINFPNEYPIKPFEFKFTSEFPHPNIFPDGKMCISILDSPANVDMTKLWRDNRREYNKLIYKIIAQQQK